MGTSYDGVYFFGLLYDQYGEDDEAEEWPSATRAVFQSEEGDEGSDEFEAWLRRHLGVTIDPYGQPLSQHDRHLLWRERETQTAQRCQEVFGVEGFEVWWLGSLDYPTWGVSPKGARKEATRAGAVPEWSAEQVAVWRTACERLLAVLPGARGPGFFFGCQVG